MSAALEETAANEVAEIAPANTPPPMPIDVMVEKFIALRNKKDELEKAHKAKMAPYNLAMGTLEGFLLKALKDNGVTSMQAPAGTFYKTTHSSTKVETWAKVLDYIRENGAWDLLKADVSKTAVEAIIQETGKVPDGVVVTRYETVNVRKKS
jgi:hypothetical protein